MHQHLFRAAVLILIFSGLSCDRKAVPISTLNQGCSTNADCSVQPGMICDLLVVPPGGKPGTCRQSCDPIATNCPNSQVCNPISGACEQSCAGLPNPSNFCQGLLPSGSNATVACICNNGNLTAGAGGGQPICSGSAYCALTTPTSNCPNGFKPSNGSCKLACQADAECAGLNQACDSITKTCEVQCASDKAAGGSECTVLNYQAMVGSAVTSYTFGCSPITSTCVQACVLPIPPAGPNCPNNRGACYVPGGTLNLAQTGTCEASCKGSNLCSGLTGFQCAEGVCQQSCTDSAKDCQGEQNKRNGRKICDVISQVCRTGCTASSPTCAQGFLCSPITSTCVQACTGTTCLSSDARNLCYLPGTLTTGSCEKACGDNGACPSDKMSGFPSGLQCSEGICQQRCTSVSDQGCSSNGLFSGRATCDMLDSVCRVGCSSLGSLGTCPLGQGISCSPVTQTCVNTCHNPAAAPLCPSSGRATCATSTASPTAGTCEITCSGTCTAMEADGTTTTTCRSAPYAGLPSGTEYCLMTCSGAKGANATQCVTGQWCDTESCYYHSASP